MNNIKWRSSFENLKCILMEKEVAGYEVKYITAEGDMMGDLLGCQFDSAVKGGYVYFWSSGIVGRQLLDYETGEEIIDDATGEMNEEEVSALIALLARVL